MTDLLHPFDVTVGGFVGLGLRDGEFVVGYVTRLDGDGITLKAMLRSYDGMQLDEALTRLTTPEQRRAAVANGTTALLLADYKKATEYQRRCRWADVEAVKVCTVSDDDEVDDVNDLVTLERWWTAASA